MNSSQTNQVIVSQPTGLLDKLKIIMNKIRNETKDHDINTNEPSSQAYSIKQGRSRRARDARNKAESPLSIRNIINKLEKEQREKRNVPGTAGTLQHKTRFEQASHVQRANL